MSSKVWEVHPADNRYWRVDAFGAIIRNHNVPSEPFIQIVISPFLDTELTSKEPKSLAAVNATDYGQQQSIEIGVGQLPFISIGSVWKNGYIQVYKAGTEAYNRLNWSLVLRDSTGAPIEGAIAYFNFIKDVEDQANTSTSYQALSNTNGKISDQINLNSCTPNVKGILHTEYSLGYKNVWESDVEVGAWQIVIPTNRGLDENGEIDTIGIGGDNVPYVYFGHICDQDLISSEPS